MKLSASFVSLSLLFLAPSALGARISLSSVPRGTSAPANVVAGEFIVEMSSLSGLGGKRAYAGTPHEELYAILRSRDIPFSVKNEFDEANIMVGATLRLASTDDVAKVAQLPQVTAIRPVVLVPGPERINAFTVSDPKDSRIPPDSESTHVMTGVDKVHQQGIDGRGIKIGIIDTGIDYNHPSLGGGFGPGFKVIGGYDFVGDAYNGSNTAVPDNDPLDQCNGHGTHVAGIIGANPGNAFGISGVAYNASIASYRLFGCTGSVSDDIIVNALLRGYKDGMDILTLSLGGVAGWTETSSAVVASRIAKAGTVVTIAAGNDGADGSWYASSPGSGVSVISVGSVDNTAIPIQNATVSGVQHDPIPYLEALPLPVAGTLPVYATSTDTSVVDDACNPLPASTPDLSKYIVVVRRGTCTFVTKLANIAAKGGKATLIYNNGGTFSPISVGNYTAALISDTDGAFLVNQFAAKANVMITFPQSGASFNYPAPTGGLQSDFSTFGPTFDMYFKPAVSAPGGNILSTLPLKLGGWGVESGTSMATPFTAGSAALILQAKGKGQNIQQLLQTTASIVPSTVDDSAPPQTLSQSGAGLVQLNQAINYKTVVSPGQFTLNDTAHFNGWQTLWVKNTGSKTQTYTLSHVPALTALTVQPSSPDASLGPVTTANGTAAASVWLSLNKLVLFPGMSLPVFARFTAPTGLDAARLPVFSGFIQVQSASETLHVAYMGAAASLKDKTVLDTTAASFGIALPALLDGAGNPAAANVTGNYTLKGADAPTVLFRMSFGSPLVRADLVSASANIKTTIHRRSWFSWWWGQGSKSNTFAGVPIMGTLAEYDWTPRNSEGATVALNGYNTLAVPNTFANGTAVGAGSYKVLLRALKVTGDPTNEADFESWLSPAFVVNSA